MKRNVLPMEIAFEGRSIPALVTLREDGYDLSFRVQFRDAEVGHFLPGGHLEFSFARGLESGTVLDERGERLFETTIEALASIIDQLESSFDETGTK